MQALPMHRSSERSVRCGSRYASPPTRRLGRACLLCGQPTGSARARYCTDACKQRAYRLRQPTTAGDPTALVGELKQRGQLGAHTIYECPECQTRYVGHQRCSDCNRFCRALGPGGTFSQCDEPLLLTELLGL
jgi:hypothetical protein